MPRPPPELLRAVWDRRGNREGKEIRFCCPAHDDENPSARYNQEKRVWCCDVCKAGGGFVDLCRRLDVALPRESSGNSEHAYDYHDRDRKLLYQVVRKPGKNFRQRRPNGCGGWIWNLKGVERVLYRFPAVLAAIKEGKAICVVEGEKDADNVAALGLTATTNPGGAGKWRKEYSASLKGARIAIVPDNDKVGRDHAQKVAKALQGVASESRVLTLPDLPDKGDVSDWINAQRKASRSNDEIRAEIEHLIAAAPSSEQWLKEAAPAEAYSGDQAEEEDPKPNQSQVLTEIASDAEYFHAPDGTAYATVEINGHKETWPIRSKRFAEWLTHSFFEREFKPPGSEPLNGALRLAESWARWDGEELPVFAHTRSGRRSTRPWSIPRRDTEA